MTTMPHGFSLKDLVNEFVGAEQEQDAIPVLDDEVAMRVLQAWTKLDHAWSPPARACPAVTATSRARVWAWIVDGWTIDHDALAVGAGCTERVARLKMAQLVANRLVYPTGDMSKGARAALAAFVAKKLRSARRRTPKDDAPPKRDGADNN